jgi:transposase/IS5 family transposase
MRAFITPNREQKILMTEVDLDSIAPVGSPLRTIDELVESLNTGEIEKVYDLDSPQGQNPFHPKPFIKVALYAIYNCRFSLRKMQEDTTNHLGYKWLTGDRSIDHSTIGYFLARFHQQVVELFSQVVAICKEKGLIEFDLLAIDSVKMRANASYKQSKNLEGIEKEEQKIRRRLGELLRGVEKGREAEEREALEYRQERLVEAKEVLEKRIAEAVAGKSQKEAEQIAATEKINVTDPDARIMEQGNGERNPAYSVTTTTDVGSDIITHYQVNAEDHDAGVLLEAVEGSQDQSGGTHEVVVADAGFASKENYEELEADGQEALIPDRRMEAERRGETVKGQWDRGKFIYDERRDNYICPGGEELRKLGEAMINGRKHFRYGNASACGECPFRQHCTKGSVRVILRDANEEVVERMRERLAKEENRVQYRLRAHAAESPYGNAKRNLKFSYVLRRGIEKVRMEMALLFMLHNGMKLRPCMSG